MLALALWSNAIGWPLLAAVLVYWARVRALRAVGYDAAFPWFTFIRRVRSIATTCMVAALAISAFGVVNRALWPRLSDAGTPLTATLAWAWIFAPLFAIQILVPLLSHAVALQLRTSELTWMEVRRQVLWSTATFASITFGLVHAMGALWGMHWT